MPRARSASAHRKVLDAALKLVAERGVDATSMDAIAQESGVSKATIYKHWKDKDALMLEVMADVTGLNLRPRFDSANVRTGLVAVLAYQPDNKADVRDRVMPHFVAYSARNQAFGYAWRNMVMEPPRRDLRRLLQLGVANGDLSPDLDLDLALTLLLGPMLYRHIFAKKPFGAALGRKRRLGAAPSALSDAVSHPARLAEAVVAAFWRAFGSEKTQATASPACKSTPRGIA
jgi:AcrR family transcriptional regulator